MSFYQEFVLPSKSKNVQIKDLKERIKKLNQEMHKLQIKIKQFSILSFLTL